MRKFTRINHNAEFISDLTRRPKGLREGLIYGFEPVHVSRNEIFWSGLILRGRINSRVNFFTPFSCTDTVSWSSTGTITRWRSSASGVVYFNKILNRSLLSVRGLFLFVFFSIRFAVEECFFYSLGWRIETEWKDSCLYFTLRAGGYVYISISVLTFGRFIFRVDHCEKDWWNFAALQWFLIFFLVELNIFKWS